ncbi:hypothetical protein U8335_01155 [Roseiconus lacunae]|uniref:hypothetical protein n=1 Tax=Roseiconus lacunae TaxID=2605694 RepID=UPI001E2F87E2|nr:hypothetical protein [Roseiconus lacunae]MCD0461502.1 hypothetical protein [Roseiconus lacunae]WRQ51155.1 hypothetical protein U8335_01155 [Stieleria sp. HD01]
MDAPQSKPKKFIDPTMLFRFEIPIRQHKLEWTGKGLALPETCRIASLGALSGRNNYADVRLAWDDTGIGIHVQVTGKKQLPWCRETRLDESDGFHLWLDTRCSPNIHRATAYCHRFLFMPSGGGPTRGRPVASLIEINRARANPKPVPPNTLQLKTLARQDGYELSGLIPAVAMTGFAPKDQSRLGFYFIVIDRELGWQTLSLGPEYPVAENPSLWAEADLVS